MEEWEPNIIIDENDFCKECVAKDARIRELEERIAEYEKRIPYKCPTCNAWHLTESSRLALLEKVLQELRNIADAKRFNRDHFRDDTEFADWVKSRSNFTIRAYDDAALDAAKEG